jgi:hypothetical protein
MLPRNLRSGMSMKAVQEVIGGLLKTGLAAVGILYAVEVLWIYAESGDNYRPELHRANKIQFIERLLIWAGVVLIGALLRLSRPVLNMLTEASADLGEWALARRAVGVPVQGPEPGPRA